MSFAVLVRQDCYLSCLIMQKENQPCLLSSMKKPHLRYWTGTEETHYCVNQECSSWTLLRIYPNSTVKKEKHCYNLHLVCLVLHTSLKLLASRTLSISLHTETRLNKSSCHAMVIPPQLLRNTITTNMAKPCFSNAWRSCNVTVRMHRQVSARGGTLREERRGRVIPDFSEVQLSQYFF